MTDDNQLTEVTFLRYMDKFKEGVYKKINNVEKEVVEVKTVVGNNSVNIEKNSDDIKLLEGKSDKWDRLNSIGIFFGALITGIISVLPWNRQ